MNQNESTPRKFPEWKGLSRCLLAVSADFGVISQLSFICRSKKRSRFDTELHVCLFKTLIDRIELFKVIKRMNCK